MCMITINIRSCCSWWSWNNQSSWWWWVWSSSSSILGSIFVCLDHPCVARTDAAETLWNFYWSTLQDSEHCLKLTGCGHTQCRRSCSIQKQVFWRAQVWCSQVLQQHHPILTYLCGHGHFVNICGCAKTHWCLIVTDIDMMKKGHCPQTSSADHVGHILADSVQGELLVLGVHVWECSHKSWKNRPGDVQAVCNFHELGEQLGRAMRHHLCNVCKLLILRAEHECFYNVYIMLRGPKPFCSTQPQQDIPTASHLCLFVSLPSQDTFWLRQVRPLRYL